MEQIKRTRCGLHAYRFSDYNNRMPIRRLPPLLVNQIAAGEVIERPASVVKELIENSLDAGATQIDVHVEQGGQQMIQVSDDGSGISSEELALAVASHSTSKLMSAEDLSAIHTLGFRGEALASISSVSRIRLISRATVEGQLLDAGAMIEASGPEVGEPKPSACAPGTVVQIRDLFFNTPARRKFMRSVQTEFGHIVDIVNRLAMVHHTIGFRLRHNGRMRLELSSAPSPTPNRWCSRRILQVLGPEIEEAMLDFEEEDFRMPDGQASRSGTRVWGMAGLPQLAKGTSKAQYICVNGRPVKDRSLAHAVREAYRGLIPHDKHPMVVVLIDIEPLAVDVNVHPTKAEVRFRDPSYVHGLVLTAIRQRLLATDLTPSAMIGGLKSKNLPMSVEHTPNTDAFVDHFRKMDFDQKGLVFEQVKRALAEEGPNLLGQEALASTQDADLASSQLRLMKILQVHNSYIVTQDDEGMLIVDQHALHERVMFEELRQRIAGSGSLESQRLLMPLIVEADEETAATLANLRPLLEQIGVEITPFGDGAMAVQSFSSFLFDRNVDPESFVQELLAKADRGELNISNDNDQEVVLGQVLNMMACKAAVKAGDRMSEAELSALLMKRGQIERSSNCPHGRPTTLRLTLSDLEKQFGRT